MKILLEHEIMLETKIMFGVEKIPAYEKSRSQIASLDLIQLNFKNKFRMNGKLLKPSSMFSVVDDDK